MSIDQSGRDHKRIRSGLARFRKDLVKKLQSITALRAATWTNHMRVFRPYRRVGDWVK